MLINKCKISIYTTHSLAPGLQSEVSRQFHVLKKQIAQRVEVWQVLQQRSESVGIERLVLNIGTLPMSDFCWQFTPRVLEALDEALNNLQLPDEDVMANETGFDDSSATASESPSFLDSSTSMVPINEMRDRLLHYLRTGHWPPANCVSGEDNPPQANLHSPARWLEAHLAQDKDPGDVLWPSLLTTLTEPHARQRLLVCLSPPLWSLWVQQLVSGLMPVDDVNNMREPDAINLLLLLWRHRVMSAVPDLPVMVHFSPAELQLPSPVQCRDIEALVLSSNGKSALRAQPGWLLRLVERFGERLWSRFSAQAQQRMLTVLPEMAPILRKVYKAGHSREESGVLLSPLHQPSGALPAHENSAGQEDKNLLKGAGTLSPPLPRPSQPPLEDNEVLRQGNASSGRQSLLPHARRPGRPLTPNSPSSPLQGPWPKLHPDVANEPVAVHHAGLVLLWPLLPRWLGSVGLLTPKSEGEKAPLVFASSQAQLEAIAALDDLIWQDGDGGEWRSLLSKLLCGCPLQVPLAAWPSQERLDVLRILLESQLQFTLQQLQQLQYMQSPTRPGLGKLTVRDLCQLFLQRPGTLTETRSGWRLTVASHPADVMLWALPWPLEQIMFPWMTDVLDLNWEMSKFPLAT